MSRYSITDFLLTSKLFGKKSYYSRFICQKFVIVICASKNNTRLTTGCDRKQQNRYSPNKSRQITTVTAFSQKMPGVSKKSGKGGLSVV